MLGARHSMARNGMSAFWRRADAPVAKASCPYAAVSRENEAIISRRFKTPQGEHRARRLCIVSSKA